MSWQPGQFELAMGSVLPGGDPLPRSTWERMAGLSPKILRSLPDDVRVIAGAVMVAARTVVGRLDEALDLGEREMQRLSLSGVVDTARRGAGPLLVAVAEAHATAGAAAETARFAALARDAEGADPAVAYRARGLLALGRALNGEYAAAAAAVDEARRQREQNGWRVSQADFPLLLAQVLLASSALDAAELDRLAGVLTEVGGGAVVWSSTAATTTAMAMLCRGELAEGLALTRRILHGVDQAAVLEMIRGFALGIRADLLLLRGDPAQALSLLSDAVSPPGHALCFDMQRAAAYLQLGRDREALRATDRCLRMGTTHCLRTIPPLLLRRAVAAERRGDAASADEDFAEAFHLLSESGSFTPLLTVPKPETLVLLERLGAAAPHQAAAVAAIGERIAAVPIPARTRPALPTLTGREVAVARALPGAGANAEIAAELGVSINTVKVHLRNLYAKLGVADRADALASLESSGFFDLP